MDCFRITGGVPLIGTAEASGAKNAALPILAATILAHDPVTIHRAPDVTDVNTLSLLLGTLGAALALLGPGAWSADARLFGWKRMDIRDRKSSSR